MASAAEASSAGVEAVTSQVASLTLDSSLPLWFKPELFTEPEFSPVAYVSDLRRYVRTIRMNAAGGPPCQMPVTLPTTLPTPTDCRQLSRVQVPLETLSSELESHLGALKNKLVEVPGPAAAAAVCPAIAAAAVAASTPLQV